MLSQKKFILKKYENGALVDIIAEHPNHHADPNYVSWNIEYANDADDFDLDKIDCEIQGNVCLVTCNEYEFIGNKFTITASVGDSSTHIVAEVISL